jgi:hypothetical protein
MENENSNNIIKNEGENTETITLSQEESKEQGGAVLSEIEPVKTAGRPSKYDDSLCDKVDEYLKQAVDKEMAVIKQTTNNDGTVDIKEVSRYKVQLPTIEGFAIFIDVALSSIYKWANENQIFSESLEKIKKIQKQRLLEEGLAGNYNSTIAKLILSSNHNMREGSDITSDGKMITNEPVKIILEDFSEKQDESEND